MPDVDRLNIDEEDRELYKKLETLGIFKCKDNKEQLLFAAAFALLNNQKRLPLNKKFGFVRESYLQEEDMALYYAITLFENKNENMPEKILKDKNNVYKIIEEYAHAGIQVLSQTKIDENFWLDIERILNDKFETYMENKQ